MNVVRQPVTIVAAIVLIGLGLLNFVYQDSLLTWQPVPKDASWRMPFVYLSGIVLIASGAGLLIPRFRPMAAAVAAGWFAIGAIALHLPIVAKAHDAASLLGLGEASACALGLATLSGRFDTPNRDTALRIAFGLCLVIFGISHFVYADFTAAMVPTWLPQRLAIAHLAGSVHALTGLCLLLGVRVRIAATIEALMMSSFVLLLHIPAVVGAPHDRGQLTMLGMAAVLTLAAWLVASWPALRDGWPVGSDRA